MVTNICLVREQNEDNNRNKWKDRNVAGNWENRTLLEAFQELGITQVHAPCGGIGTCKKCLVNVNGENVLSCQTMCEDGMMGRTGSRAESK